jgi:energy-coupling factor transporter ATP-binding protein EcfA2
MRLVQAKQHLSIVEFPAIELPDFTLITGLNGSGKSHLLQAIENRSITVDIAPEGGSDIRLFSWSNMMPRDSGVFDGHTLVQERSTAATEFEQHLATTISRLTEAAKNLGIPAQYYTDVRKLVLLEKDDLEKIIGDSSRAEQAVVAIDEASKIVSRKLLNRFSNTGHRKIVESTASRLGLPAAALREQDIIAAGVPVWGETDLFQQSFSRLFVAYRDLRLTNLIKQMQRDKGKIVEGVMTDDEFERKHMLPPWRFVNDALLSAGLPFEIDHPLEYESTPYQPRLRKQNTDADITFDNLSSGEKIIMSFALCLYYANDSRQITNYPKLVLFDEIDAPLHPSMSKSLLKTIKDALIDKNAIKVIATTHSASTVALAPEESLYFMEAGRPGLHKTTRAQALNILTVDVPTLAISYDGRRQVFVESPIDAQVYDQAFQILKPRFATQRSLQFLATGTRSKDGDRNTGCELVKKIVSELTGNGNNSVFGLIDWDGKHDRSERIEVLAVGRRNGLENLFLDPLLLASLIMRDVPNHKDRISSNPEESYVEFIGSDFARLQAAVDLTIECVLARPSRKDRPVGYAGGFTLVGDAEYLTTDDHLLERRVTDALPATRAISKNKSGALIERIVSGVIRDKPEFTPTDLLEAFEALLTRPAHN